MEQELTWWSTNASTLNGAVRHVPNAGRQNNFNLKKKPSAFSVHIYFRPSNSLIDSSAQNVYILNDNEEQALASNKCS